MSFEDGHRIGWNGLPSDNQWEYFGFENLQFSQLLARMREPNIRRSSAGQSVSEFYRIVCLPAFDRPYCVRWQRTGDRSTAVYKETDGGCGWDRGHLCRERETSLSPDQWQRITTVLDKHYFWTTPRFTPCDGLDGESWLMEGLRDMDYRVISRWNGGTIEAILLGSRDVVPEIRNFRPHGEAG